MRSEDIAYMARVNAGHWLIRKAGKIVSRLAVTAEHQQAIETEIVAIGRRMYEDARREPQPEATHHPGEDHELEAYISAVQELVPDIDEPKIKHYRDLEYTPEQAAKRWRGYCRFLQESKNNE